MILSNKVAELIEQLETDQLNDLSWRGLVDDKEWKILIHKDSTSGAINIVVKPRNRVA